MPDQFTSETGGNKVYVVKFEPGGERVLVRASNANQAGDKALGIAEIVSITHRGAYDVNLGTEYDAEDLGEAVWAVIGNLAAVDEEE